LGEAHHFHPEQLFMLEAQVSCWHLHLQHKEPPQDGSSKLPQNMRDANHCGMQSKEEQYYRKSITFLPNEDQTLYIYYVCN
jgi:hypothetical protein